ncbi:ATP-binding protein [Streptomyces parvus]|uniref:ATP-binding protein n=1 Tax=Streptomyces parvus TaxID=66428 RepID=UPI0033C54A36
MGKQHEDSSQVHNQISDGVFYNTVVQGNNVNLQLPNEITPALTGMPAPSSTFTGRATVLDRLVEELRPCRRDGTGPPVHVVAGLPGVGKTELVLQVGRRASQQGWFPGGILFIDLYGYDGDRHVSPDRALGSLLQALGVPDQYIPKDFQDRARLYRSVLSTYADQGRRILVIVDNARNDSQAKPLLSADSRVPVLVTSRHTLTGLNNARIHDLAVLDPASAVELLRRDLHQARGLDDSRVDDAPESAASIAHLCGHLPLALRIVAALLADLPARPLSSMVKALGDTRNRLQRLSRGDLAVRTAFELSYHHLSDDQARLFRLLPINPGPDISTESAGRLAALSSDEAEDLLGALARAHLVEPHAKNYGRWRLHDLLRLYADEECTRREEAHERRSAASRLLDHYLTMATAADTHVDAEATALSPHFSGREHALHWLDSERQNLLAAARSAPALGHPDVLVDLHYSLMDYLSWRRHWDDSAQLSQAALEAARSPRYPELHKHESALLNNLGTAQRELRRFEDSVRSYRASLAKAEKIGDVDSKAKTLSNLGRTYEEMHRLEEAVEVLQHALTLPLLQKDLRTRGMAHTNLGRTLHKMHRLDEAADAFIEDIAICQSIRDRSGEAVALNNLGMVMREMGLFGVAIHHHTRSLTAARESQDSHTAALAQANLAMEMVASGRSSGVIKMLKDSLAVLEDLDDSHMAVQCQFHLSFAYERLDRRDEALALLFALAESSKAAGNRHPEAMALSNIGLILAEAGRSAEAIEIQVRAISLHQSLRDVNSEGKSLLGLGIALSASGRTEKAIQAFSDAATAFKETGDSENLALAAQKLTEAKNSREARSNRSPGPIGYPPPHNTLVV